MFLGFCIDPNVKIYTLYKKMEKNPLNVFCSCITFLEKCILENRVNRMADSMGYRG